MSSLLKNLIIALAITVVIGLIYMFIMGNSEEGMVSGEVSSGSFEIRMQNEKILANTREINNYTMDVSVLYDTRFTSLRNYHIKIEDVRTGRTNPFAALE